MTDLEKRFVEGYRPETSQEGVETSQEISHTPSAEAPVKGQEPETSFPVIEKTTVPVSSETPVSGLKEKEPGPEISSIDHLNELMSGAVSTIPTDKNHADPRHLIETLGDVLARHQDKEE